MTVLYARCAHRRMQNASGICKISLSGVCILDDDAGRMEMLRVIGQDRLAQSDSLRGGGLSSGSAHVDLVCGTP